MYFNFISKKISASYKKILVFSLGFFMLSNIAQSQIYSNGPFSTGTTAFGGAVAPTGFTWSELQLTNNSLGASPSVFGGFTIIDDFTVTASAGSLWKTSKISFYGYSTAYTGTLSPYNDVRVRIFNSNPAVGNPTPIFGNLSANIFLASASTKAYRVGRGAPTPNTTRQIWKIEATLNTELVPGTYWVEYQLGTPTTIVSNFTPLKTVPNTTTQAGNNAQQRVIATNVITAITDAGNLTAQDVPFEIDYTVTPCTPVTVTTQPSNQTTTCGTNVSFSVVLAGIQPTYQWQIQTTAGGVWNNLTNSATYSGVNTPKLDISNIPVSFNGYNYRVVYTGGCTGTSFTNAAALTVNPLTAVVTPTAATICAGSNTITKISIGNVGNSTTATFNSPANLNIEIPDDGSTIGVNNTINVATLPPTAIVTGIRVKMNMIHTWVGDLIIVLKAPNGKVFNLAYALTGTGGASPTTGLTNTTFSSTPNPLGVAFPTFVSGTNPYTSTFSADGFSPATGDPNVPTGPDLFVPINGTTFPELYTIGNGNWTLALYDYFQDDLTTNRFVNWSIDITYGALANGIFTSTPASPNTIFTDTAATVPYNGTTPINTVYVKPNVTTNYAVAINTGTCTANATVPVTVNTTPTGTLVTPNSSACEGFNAPFTLNGLTAGTALTYQWQVLKKDSLNYVNVTNATSISYTVPNVTLSQNGDRYRIVVTSVSCATTLTSTPGTLTVNAVPTVTLSVSPTAKLQPNTSATITANITNGASGASYQFLKDGVPVVGATTNTLNVNYANRGTYTVRVVNAAGCSNPANLSVPESIIIGDSIDLSLLFIYPSPNNGQFQVRYFNDANDFANGPAILNIYDSKGLRVFTNRYPNTTTGYNQFDVNLTKFAKGIYRIEVISISGGRLKTGSVLVL